MGEDAAVELAARLRDAQRRLAELDVAPASRERLARRLIAVTTLAKRDVERALERLAVVEKALSVREKGAPRGVVRDADG